MVADTPHNHSYDTSLYFCVDVDTDGKFDIPRELFRAFQLSDLRRYAKTLARRVLRYGDSVESERTDEKQRAELLAAYLLMASLEYAEAQQLITRQPGRLESETLSDEEAADLLLARAVVNKRLGDTLAVFEDSCELRRRGRKEDANREIALSAQFHPEAVYEYAEAHPEIYGEASFIISLPRLLAEGGTRVSGQVERQTPPFANEADVRAILRIIYRLDFAQARRDPVLTRPKDYSAEPPSWQKAKREETAQAAKEPSSESAPWEKTIIGWAEEKLRSLGIEESKVQAFRAYKLGQAETPIPLSDLGL